MPDRLSLSNKPFQGLADKIDAIRADYVDSQRWRSVRLFAERAAMSPTGRVSLEALFANLKGLMRYIPNPTGAQLMKSPREIIAEIKSQGWAAGSCIDDANLSYSLLHSLGIGARLAIGWYPGDEDPAHIWVRIPASSGPSIDFDLTGPRLGDFRPNAVEVHEYA